MPASPGGDGSVAKVGVHLPYEFLFGEKELPLCRISLVVNF